MLRLDLDMRMRCRRRHSRVHGASEQARIRAKHNNGGSGEEAMRQRVRSLRRLRRYRCIVPAFRLSCVVMRRRDGGRTRRFEKHELFFELRSGKERGNLRKARGHGSSARSALHCRCRARVWTAGDRRRFQCRRGWRRSARLRIFRARRGRGHVCRRRADGCDRGGLQSGWRKGRRRAGRAR